MRNDRRDEPFSQDRRSFLKAGAIAGLGAAIAGMHTASAAEERGAGEARTLFRVKPIEQVRVGFVGVGGMGSGHLGNYLRIDGVQIKAVCDIVPAKVERAQNAVVKAGQPKPAGYANGPTDFVRMCETEDLDLVMTATPWEWHVPVCEAAMKNGKHAATEVPAAMTLEDCWKLVEAAEKFGKHCQMMENCCYDRIELMTLNMVRKGLLGEVLHAEAGYLHDLRAVKFGKSGEGLWRRAWSEKLNGNLYPTHGLGPVAQCMNINRGDAFDYLVSMSGPARGLHEYAVKKFGADSPQAREKYVLGDVNSSLIKTKLGKTIILIHDVNLPRPYSRINLVQGTKGIAHKYPDRIYIEEQPREASEDVFAEFAEQDKASPNAPAKKAEKPKPRHGEWQDFENYAAKYEHPLWKAFAQKGKGIGHGSMDFIEDYRLLTCLQKGEPLDQDVYDAAAWSAIVGASVESVAHKSKAVEIPDFTRGKWKTTPPLGIVEG
ncbi:MAG: Gfo/Idh/MocA family oxidoreductase [Pirellulales bacterium]|nr:Gfo/Idh/MocA family oxidoreductase [Pirellulales bacterium]